MTSAGRLPQTPSEVRLREGRLPAARAVGGGRSCVMERVAVSSISSGVLVSRRRHPLSNDLSDTEMVMLDIERGTYFGLQGVGKTIWDSLETPATVDELCVLLMDRFEVDGETCRRDVTSFLEALRAHDLIEVHGARSAP